MDLPLRLHILCMLILLALFSGLASQVSIASTHKHHHSIYHSKKKIAKRKHSQLLAKKRMPTTPSTSSPSFDQRFIRFLRRWRIPGSAVAILQNDKFILSRGYGWADLENHQPMTQDSVFRVASVSKAITAVAIMKLAQEGKLNLDSKVYHILDDLQPLSDKQASSRIYTISVRNLLEMSSGWITDRGTDPMLGAWSSNMRRQLQNQIPPDCKNAARMMMTIPMQYTPGTQYSYSNISYCMLGLIINKVTGSNGSSGYEAYVKQHLLIPYGITSMHIGDNSPGKQATNEVHYYYCDYKCTTKPNSRSIYDGLPYGQTNLLQKNFSDGGWVASAPDLAKFLQALSKNKILTPTSIREMTAKPSFQTKWNSYFAKGFSIKYIKGHFFMMKTGSFTGTQALVMLEDNGTAYVALFNAKPSNRKAFLAQLRNLLFTYPHGD